MSVEMKRSKSKREGQKAATTPVCPLTVRWEGAQRVRHSLGIVNQELCSRVLEAGVEISLVPTEASQFAPQGAAAERLALREFAPLSKAADVHVRHFFPPRLNRPDEGAFVLMQPWEYGYLPIDWVELIQKNVDEVWCYSNYVKQVYADCGIDPAKLFVTPLGVDPGIFRPDGLVYQYTSEPGVRQRSEEAPFTFLYVGGTIHRKGFDIALDAYCGAFTAFDNVRLVIKDTGVQTVYRGANERERILAYAADKSKPEIIYIEQELSARQLASIYRSANCLLAPYRREGFLLTALEAMSVGVPPLVPEGTGPTSDFVDGTVGWLVPAERRPFGKSKVGDWHCCGPTWMFEVDPHALARLMRQISADPDEVARRGAAAAERARTLWTWGHSAAIITYRLKVLAASESSRARKVVAVDNVAKAAAPIGATKDAEPLPAWYRGGSEGAKPPARVRRRPTVALCMIVRNEERVLGDCLESAAPHFDEIHIVDTGSTDATKKIAKRFTKHVYSMEWQDSFSIARNESLRHSTADWNWWMDADDTLPQEVGERIRETAFLAPTQTLGFIVPVRIPPAPGTYGTTVVDHVKLFRNRPDLRFEYRLHEQILDSIRRAGGEIERSDLWVEHTNYDYSPEGQAGKRKRDWKHLDLDELEHPLSSFVKFNIGMTAFYTSDYDRAILSLTRSLELCSPTESIVRKNYAFLGGAYMAKMDLPAARAALTDGLELYPRDPELLFRAGQLFHLLGDLPRAEGYYLRLFRDRETGHIDSLDISTTTFKAAHRLAALYIAMGRFPEAEAQLRQALAWEPRYTPALDELRRLLVTMNRHAEAAALGR